jgi:hypothetical protein
VRHCNFLPCIGRRRSVLVAMFLGAESFTFVSPQVGMDSKDLDKVAEDLDDKAHSVQCLLREQLSQLRIESGLFLRLMYKNKNQHRRTHYYQRLSEVRRNLQQLSGAGLDETVEGCRKFFSPKQLSANSSKFRYAVDEVKSMRTLLSVARLLNHSDGPILAGSAQLAGLLGQSFFMPFALTMFSCLARFRVLLIQILYEVVISYNLLSTVSQRSLKSLVDSADKNASPSLMGQNLPVELECQWDGVKLCMIEIRRPTSLPEKTAAASEVPAELSNSWFVDDRTGAQYHLKIPALDAGPSESKNVVESSKLGETAVADLEQVIKPNPGDIEATLASNKSLGSDSVRRTSVAYVSIKSPLDVSQRKNESDTIDMEQVNKQTAGDIATSASSKSHTVDFVRQMPAAYDSFKSASEAFQNKSKTEIVDAEQGTKNSVVDNEVTLASNRLHNDDSSRPIPFADVSIKSALIASQNESEIDTKDLDQVTKQSLGGIEATPASNKLQTADPVRRKPVAYVSVKSALKPTQKRSEDESKSRPQPTESTSSEKRQQLLTGSNSKTSELKRSNVDSKDSPSDGETKRKKTDDIFAMLLG